MKTRIVLNIIMSAGSLLALGACTSLTVKKVTPDDNTTEGIRYALPQLFLRATPVKELAKLV